MGFLDFFKKQQRFKKESTWKELGMFNAMFSGFGTNLYSSDVVRSCIRPLAEHTSKANAFSTDKSVEKILNTNPNMYMSGKDFLSKVRTRLELQNTAFICIMRDDKGHATGFYPVPYESFEAVEYKNGLFIQFYFSGNAARTLVLPWNDLAVLRKDYNESDIAGDDNRAVLPMLELISTSNQGISNAVRATANLRGILKSTKAMLSPVAIKEQKDQFVKDYLNLENSGGIASLDATQEFTPISINPKTVDAETMKEFRENVYRYFGVNDAIVMSKYTEEQMEAFYNARIEPFLVALSLELTRKCFTERERSFGANIMYESARIQYASNRTKLALVRMVDRGALTPNEWRATFNLAPIEGGDVPIRRLDTAEIGADTDQDEDLPEPEEQEPTEPIDVEDVEEIDD